MSRELTLTDAQVDRLRADQHDSLAVIAERFEGVDQDAR